MDEDFVLSGLSKALVNKDGSLRDWPLSFNGYELGIILEGIGRVLDEPKSGGKYQVDVPAEAYLWGVVAYEKIRNLMVDEITKANTETLVEEINELPN